MPPQKHWFRTAWVALAAGLASAASLIAAPQSGGSPLQDPNHETRTPDVPGLSAATSRCRVSDDTTYAVSPANPIKVGGGAMYLASREVKYLSALRGPAGQGLHFKRAGTVRQDDTILDVYGIDYPGLDKSVRVYLDGYHWSAPLAPAGWLCGADMNLAPPGPDPFETQAQLRTLAVRLGDHPVVPISLDPDGSAAHGVVFDQVRLIALAARKAAAAGKPLDPRSLPREVVEPHTAIVAFPLTCEGRTIAPDDITLADRNGNAPPVVTRARDGKVRELLPGYEAPAGSIAVTYSVSGLIDGARASVRYAESCGTQGRDVLLPVRTEPGHVTRSVPGIAPPGVTLPPAGVQVHVQVFVDADGALLLPAYVSGPLELSEAAMAAAKEWRIEPPKMNGAPVLGTSTVAIAFRPPD